VETGFAELARLERATRQGGPPGPARAEILAAFGPLVKDGRPGTLSAAARHAAAGPPVVTVTAGPGQEFRALTALAARYTGDLPPAVADRFWDFQHRADASQAQRDARWGRLQAALLRRRGPDQLGYLGAVCRYGAERRSASPASHLCGNRLFRITAEFTVLGGYRRELCFCERCGLLADLPEPGMPVPFLVAAGAGVLVAGSPWRRPWLTAAIAPAGSSLFAASAPRRATMSEPVPVPGVASMGRRLGVALVHGGDHVIVQTPLPPFQGPC
jgi:hypothetical protein